MTSIKPYLRIYAPLSIRQELPPSPTPSPTGFIASMRLESAPPGSHVHSEQVEERPAAAADNAAPSPERSTQGASTAAEPPIFQAYPMRNFDATLGIKIPRPHGAHGKPSAGGYSLSVELNKYGWSNVEYKAVQASLQRLVKGCLDKTKPFAKQDPSAIRRFMNQVLERYPGLEYFEDEWPARALATQYLKNSPDKTRSGTQEPA